MAVSNDPDLLAWLVHRVAVYRDANASGSVTNPHGTAVQNFQPVPGLGSVACRLSAYGKVMSRKVDGREFPVQRWVVLLNQSLDVGVGHVLWWTDPDLGSRTRFLNLEGAPVDESGVGHHWSVMAYEQVGP